MIPNITAMFYPRYRAVALLSALMLCAACPSAFAQAGNYQSTPDFLSESLGSNPTSATYTLTKEDKEAAKKILGHNYKTARIRYWTSGKKTAWVLEEIGKTQPITTGFAVDDRKIDRVRVLVYRESHGGEVKNKFFTKQFNGAKLGAAPTYSISKRINSISGATLSVNALRKLSRFALYLDSKVKK